MNKKQKTYLLLTFVIIVWSLIGYNIYSYLNPTVEKQEIGNQEVHTILTEPLQKDTLVISSYRDPFLGRIITNKRKIKKQEPVVVNFPTVIYHGLVKGNNTKSYIISVQNQQEIVKVGKAFLNVKLISANAKEITVMYKGVRKIIKLQD